MFSTTGTLRSLAWSPNGRRLLVRWADADQWLLLSPGTANAPITAIGSISRRFGAVPTVQGWCCAAENRHTRRVTRNAVPATLAAWQANDENCTTVVQNSSSVEPERDRERDAILARSGYRTLRFTHRQLTRDPAMVAETIKSSA